MSFGWCVKFAGVVVIGGLLTIGEVLAQQPAVAETHLTKSIRSGSESNTAPQPNPPQALFLPKANQLTLLDEAYLDAFGILKEDNTCSAFYGGPAAILVLNQLKQQLKPTYLDSRVAVRMTGKAMEVTSLRYSLSYRFFDKVELNVSGPFFRGNAFHSNRSVVPNIGSFLPNTREARVTILLHELGHLIERPDKQWLLPNDGNSAYLSEENTERVIAVCGKQIKRLSRISFAQELQAARHTLPGRPANEANVFVP
jgi:hypothetical protein